MVNEGIAQLHDYALLDELGRGGAACVFRGVHLPTGDEVAVKVLTGRQLGRGRAVSAFRNEARATARLDHPNITRIIDLGTVDTRAADESKGVLSDGSPFLVMPYLRGGTLAEVVGGLTWWQIRAVLLMLLDALAHAHARGIIHRDLKPANVLLDTSRSGLRLSDFGLAHALDSAPGAAERQLCGTPLFMAPEQCRREARDYGPWTDFYALGCLGYTLAQGRSVFSELITPERVLSAHVNAKHPPLAPRCVVPAGFQDWLDAMVAKDPSARPARAAIAARALEELPARWEPGAEWLMPTDEDDVITDPDLSAVAGTLNFDRGDERRITLGATVDDMPFDQSLDGSLNTLDGIDGPTQFDSTFPSTWRSPADRASGPQDWPDGIGLQLFWLRTPRFVGRWAERDRLWDALRDVCTRGQPGAVVLSGAEGSGRSRLLQWLCERGHEIGGADSLRVEFDGSGLDPIAQALAGFFRLDGLETGPLQTRCEVVLARLGISNPSEATTLARLVRPEIGFPLAGPERLAFVVRVLVALGRRRPLILSIDDAWRDPDALELARRVVRHPAAGPILVALTVVADGSDRGGLGRGARLGFDVDQIHLEPLEGVDRTLLLRSLLPLEPGLTAALEGRAGGSPQLAVQLVGHLVDQDALEPSESGFQLREGVPLEVPRSLAQAWRQRVTTFLAPRSEDARVRLEVAAVLGASPDPEEWEDLCRTLGLGRAPDLVNALLDFGLAVPVDGAPDAWRFANALILQEVLSLCRVAKRFAELHAATARWLSGRGGQRQPERVADHWEHAGLPSLAIDPLLDGIAARLELGELQRAEVLLARQQQILMNTSVSSTDRRRTRAALLGLRLALLRGDDASFTARRTELQGLLGEHGPDDLVGRLELDLSRWEIRAGNLEDAAAGLDRVRERAELVHDEKLIARVLYDRARLAVMQGDLAKAEELFQEAVIVFERQSDSPSSARALLALSELAARRADWGRADSLMGIADRILDQAGGLLGEAHVAVVRSAVARQRGDMRGATEQLRVAVEHYRGLDSPQVTEQELKLAQTLFRADQMDEAQVLAQRALAHFAQSGDVVGLTAAHVTVLPGLAHDQRWEEYDLHLEHGLELLQSTGLVDADLAWAARQAGDLAAAAGQPQRAWRAFALARDQLGVLGLDMS